MFSFLKESQRLIKFKDFRIRLTWILFLKTPSLVTENVVRGGKELRGVPATSSGKQSWRTYLPAQGFWLCCWADMNSTGHSIRKVVLSRNSVPFLRQSYWTAEQLSTGTEMPDLRGMPVILGGWGRGGAGRGSRTTRETAGTPLPSGQGRAAPAPSEKQKELYVLLKFFSLARKNPIFLWNNQIYRFSLKTRLLFLPLLGLCERLMLLPTSTVFVHGSSL